MLVAEIEVEDVKVLVTVTAVVKVTTSLLHIYMPTMLNNSGTLFT